MSLYDRAKLDEADGIKTPSAMPRKLQYNDAQHAYWLDGKRCKSVTTVAKIPEDTFRLEAWSKRQVAIGLATKPSLIEQIAANVDNDSKLNDLCEQAAAEAGAHLGRDRGNVLHKALEQHDTGKRFIPTDLTSTAIVGWEAILEAMGWTVELVERCVVWPEQLIAGRFDRIVKDRDGKRFVIDFKGGAKVTSYPHAIACQLALYANAPLLAGSIPGEGGFTEEFERNENLNIVRAYVVHLPPDADAQLIEINIDQAFDVIYKVIFPTIAWRAAKGLAKVVELSLPGGDFEEIDPFAGLPSDKPEPVMNPFIESVSMDQLELDARQRNLKWRLEYLKEEHPSMAQVVASRWPEGVPNIKMPLTADDLDKIEELVIDAERQVEAPFNPVVIATDEDVRVGLQAALDELGITYEQLAEEARQNHFYSDLARRTWLAYGHTQESTIDEGPDMEPADIAAMKAELERLEPELYDRINEWVAQANNAGTSISLRHKPSKRRFSIARAMLLAVHHHEDVVRAVLSLTLGDEVQTTVTTGSVLGVLTQAEAEKAWELLLAVDAKTLVWDGFGKLVAA